MKKVAIGVKVSKAFRNQLVKPFSKPSFDYQIMVIREIKLHDLPVIIGDITKCPQIPDNTYDMVFSIDVFEHINKPWLAAKEIVRILKPGGVSYHIAPFLGNIIQFRWFIGYIHQMHLSFFFRIAQLKVVLI